jgi:hypothetical protein
LSLAIASHSRYLAGSAAGLRLLNGHRLGTAASLISLVMTAAILLFVKWTALYAVAITAVWLVFALKARTRLARTRPPV